MEDWQKPDWKQLDYLWWDIVKATNLAIERRVNYVVIVDHDKWPGWVLELRNKQPDDLARSCYRYRTFNFPNQAYPENVLYALWDEGFIDCSEGDIRDFLDEYARPIYYSPLSGDDETAKRILKAGWGPKVREGVR